MVDANKLLDMIQAIEESTAKKVTSDNITVYKDGANIIIDIKEEK